MGPWDPLGIEGRGWASPVEAGWSSSLFSFWKEPYDSPSSKHFFPLLSTRKTPVKHSFVLSPEVRLLGFESWLCHLGAEWCWTRYMAPLCFNFTLSIIGITVPHKVFINIKWVNTWKAYETVWHIVHSQMQTIITIKQWGIAARGDIRTYNFYLTCQIVKVLWF